MEWYESSQKITRCGQETDDGCGAKQPDKLKLEGMDGIYAVWSKLDVDKSVKTQLFQTEKVREIFERMTDEDISVLGFLSRTLVRRPE